ncbi:putative oxidoreductase FAD-binding domain [Lyophyllum shimeji]|uniref:Oxidoreductase FAD-binding domain n=1 Tax=Lyophyllum shimeji TaxID=47721 RepID=A0A9P3PDK0_LYOSH|nr:putative oxidoreductase FAD-binding domain [Lyophyllum shimeji]
MNLPGQRLLHQYVLRRSLPRCRRYSSGTQQAQKRTTSRFVPLALGVGAVTGLSVYFFFPDASRSAPTLSTSPLSPSHFTPSTVISNETAGPDTKLLEVVVPPHLLPPRDTADASASAFAPIWSVFIKDDDIQVERPYTPLEGVDEEGRMLFWIKKYPKGEVGRWLHSKHGGEKLELRGPITTWPWRDGEWDEVIMISGGTGITPFYQLFHSVISRSPDAKTRFTLLHSSQTPAELPPPRIMDRLTRFAAQNPERFRLRLFVDSLDGPAPTSHMPAPHVGRIDNTAIERCLGLDQRRTWLRRLFGMAEAPRPNRKILFLVCGPDPMVNAISGPFGRNFSQGPVRGVLGEMGFTSKEVWKL